jgi:hypothetical protein
VSSLVGGVGGAILGAALIGGTVSAVGDVVGAKEQAGAAEQATNTQAGMFNEQVSNLAPYRQAGSGALAQLNYLQGIGAPGSSGTASSSPAGGYGSLNQPFTAAYMQQYSPAYKFQLQQGQQGVLNQDAGAQGALSGAALKDLTSFNQNYANTAFNNAFSQYQTQQQNSYNRLASIANLGEAAASNQATGGSNYAQSIGSSLTNVGSALGAGTVGASNALGSGVSSGALLGVLANNQAGGFGGQANPWGLS